MSNSKEGQSQMAEANGKTNSDANNNEYEGTPNPQANQSEDGSQPQHESYEREAFEHEKNRKLFVGFGNAGFSERALEEFFSKYGKVERVIIKRDVVTGKQRGFAFITMTSPEEAAEIIAVCPQDIDGKSVDIKMAKSRPISKKVFVGGIDPNLTKEAIASHFSIYGPINDIELPMDRVNKKRREFCFIIFDTEEAANQASALNKQKVFERFCDVKKATPQPIAQQQKRQQQTLHQSFNQSQQSGYNPLNQSRSSRSYYAYSPSSTKSGQSSYRGYRSNSRSDSHRNSFSGRRSVDSQHGGYHEQFGNPHGYNRKSGPPHRQSERSLNRQVMGASQYVANSPTNGQSGHHQAKNYGGHQKAHLQQQQQTRGIPNQYYDQTAHQSYYGFGVPYEYYQQPQFSQPQVHTNPVGNQYPMQQLSQTEYYNQVAANYYQQQSQQPTLQQQYNPGAISACYTNYQAANLAMDSQIATPGQQQQTQPLSTNPTDFQFLEDHIYQDRQKQFENNMINTVTYENKFGGSQDEINYQQTNHNNLLNVPFQGSMQHC